jgi:hypothetical protein
MAVRNALLGGTDFTEEGLRPTTDLNPTLNAIIEDSRNKDGFIYFDNVTLTHNTTSETSKRIYTFNKSVQGLIFCATFDKDGSTSAGRLSLYKNGVKISATKIYTQSSDISDSSGTVYYNVSGNYIITTTDSLIDEMGMSIIINESFVSTDTFELKMQLSTGSDTFTVKKIVVEGVNNVSSDTTWVSVS